MRCSTAVPERRSTSSPSISNLRQFGVMNSISDSRSNPIGARCCSSDWMRSAEPCFRKPASPLTSAAASLGEDEVKQFTIAVLPGDGIGPEVTSQAVRVLNAVADLYDYSFAVEQYSIGAAGVRESGEAFP